ncbi:MAG: hypothetical protein NXY57DRAFT_1031385 [Lentinula lateritia]|nr:MAG: hypothetical protein NXY57DRAFT_1031385 [Lentinula lateritia]
MPVKAAAINSLPVFTPEATGTEMRRNHFFPQHPFPLANVDAMAKAKARTLIVRLISTAQTGFFYTTQRVRQGLPLSAIKYDPKVKRRVLFVESKKSKKG